MTELRERIYQRTGFSNVELDAVMAVVGPLVEQLRQAEVSRDAYREERDQTQRERDEARASVEHLRGDYRRIRKDRDRLLLAWRSARRRANAWRAAATTEIPRWDEDAVVRRFGFLQLDQCGKCGEVNPRLTEALWLHAEAVWQRDCAHQAYADTAAGYDSLQAAYADGGDRLASEQESRFRWAEEAAHVTDAAKALLDMEYATASDNRMAWSAWPIEYNDLAVAIGWRGAKRPGDYTLDDLTMAPADRTQMEAERDTALAEIERLRDTLTEQVDATVTQGWEAVGAEYERTAAETEADRLRANLAALRASAVVLPEPVQRLVDWHLSCFSANVSPMPRQSEVREAMESWRPATAEPAPAVRVDTEWCVFYGGTDPYDSAGIEFYDDEADATEKIPWYEQPAGVAKRTVRRGPWETTPAAGVSGTGTEASNG